MKMVLTKSLAKKNHSTWKLASRLSSRGHQISKSTVNRYLVNHLGARAYVQQNVPKITKAQEIKRLRFCKERKKWTSEDWKDVIFSDESPYELYATPNKKNHVFWAKKKEDVPFAEKVKFPPKLMVWGAMTSSGLTDLHVVKGRTSIYSEYYSQEILQNHLLPIYTRNFTTGPVHRRKMVSAKCGSTFMQDGATCHTSVETSRWQQTHQIPFWKKWVWSPNSPDLNPIENLWAIVEQEVKSLKDSSQNLEQLEKYI